MKVDFCQKVYMLFLVNTVYVYKYISNFHTTTQNILLKSSICENLPYAWLNKRIFSVYIIKTSLKHVSVQRLISQPYYKECDNLPRSPHFFHSELNSSEWKQLIRLTAFKYHRPRGLIRQMLALREIGCSMEFELIY